MIAKKITIAIDGYSSCGKSTIAKGLAKKLDYVYVDSGAMYRAVTLYCMQHGIIMEGKFSESKVIAAMDHIRIEFKVNAALHQSETYLNGKNSEKEIRGMDVSRNVSAISTIKEVRDKIVAMQRKFGGEKGIVMDGRDIGTNVFPDAELKIFMTADPDVRARRRWEELKAKGISVSLEEVRNNLTQRDFEDTHRKHNPLCKADDAIILDNTSMTIEEQLEFALKNARQKLGT